MRGKTNPQPSMLCMISPESVVPADHPIRRIKALAEPVLRGMSETFDRMYSEQGRPSVPPERLLKASLLMALYSVRSERLFCEQLDYNLLFRWFLDMDMTERSIDHSTLSANRQRLLSHDVAGEFFAAVVKQAHDAGLMSSDHFTVDSTLIEAWASLKSFKARGSHDKDPPDDPGNPTVNFHGEKRSNATHASTTDPESKLMRRGHGKEARLSFGAHALMENRNGLIATLMIAPATDTEPSVALQMLGDAGSVRRTVAGDKGYDTKAFVAGCRERHVTPHVACNATVRRRSAIDGRTTRHAGYAISQRVRKRVEEIFGWIKTVGGFRRTRFKGLERSQFAAHLVGAAYNLLRMTKLMPAPT